MKQKIEIVWCAVLWAVLLMMVGCAHRPPITKQVGECVEMKSPGLVVAYFCSDIPGEPIKGRIP